MKRFMTNKLYNYIAYGTYNGPFDSIILIYCIQIKTYASIYKKYGL